MKQKKLIASLLFAFVSVGVVQAQEAVLSSGGEAIGAGGSSSFSIGQVVYTANSGAGGTITQGVQHAYDISTTLGEEITTVQLELSVYPNPIKDYLNLKIDNELRGNMFSQLCDMQGRILKASKITEHNTTIKMNDLPKATYFLKVTKGQEVIRTFKIIKN